jgi:type I restriction enzyme S subunit
MRKIASLCEISTPKQWKTISTDMLTEKGYPVYGANGIIGYYSEYNHEKETLLITCRGATCGALNISETFSYINGNAMAIDNLIDDVDIKYLYYYLLNRGLQDVISGSAQPQIVRQSLQKVIIEYPDLEKQREIVNKIDSADKLIKLRKKQLPKLDELVKARFVEMFGTLDNPAQEFKKATLKELCNKITDGKHGGCTQEEGTERYFVGAREIYDDKVHYDTAPEINVAEFEKDYKRCNIEIGDFLIVNTGATIGKSAIATDSRTEHTLLQKSVALLKIKKALLNPVFLKWCYKVNTKMYMVESASAQPNLLLSKINATEIYVPDIELQNQFAAFVEQTDKSKFAVQQSLDKLETLKKSLMQKYFG